MTSEICALNWRDPQSLAWLRDRIPNLNGVTHKLTFGTGDQPTLLELQLEPQGEVVLPLVNDDIQPCVECGRDPRPLPDQILIARSSIPANLHLFRARNFTTIVLATDRFVNAVQDLGLLGMRFEEVQLSNG